MLRAHEGQIWTEGIALNTINTQVRAEPLGVMVLLKRSKQPRKAEGIRQTLREDQHGLRRMDSRALRKTRRKRGLDSEGGRSQEGNDGVFL